MKEKHELKIVIALGAIIVIGIVWSLVVYIQHWDIPLHMITGKDKFMWYWKPSLMILLPLIALVIWGKFEDN